MTGGVADAVRAAFGLQAQMPAAAALSVRARTTGLVAADIERARVEGRSVVRTWCMRGTLHLVAAEDLRWLLALVGPRTIAGRARRYAELGLDEATCMRGLDVIREALAGGPLARDTLFCYFPHYTPATGNVPATWVRRGDWKLIRFFADSPDQTDRCELYHLRDDIGETNDLSAGHPDLVADLSAEIDAFLHETGAPVPRPNPSYDPQAAR